MITSIKIADTERNRLKKFSKKNNLGSYGQSISKMVDFFENNNQHPSDTINASFFLRLLKLEKSILVNQKESEVKILEKIKEEKRLLNSFEKNYLAPTILKILDFEKNKIDLDVDAYKMPDLKVENENKILKKKLETAKEFIEKKDEIILKLENKKVNSLLPEEGLKTIELIRDNYKLDTSPMGRKRVVLNLDPEIFFKLFKIIE
ncbi:BfmA/BtgA family mobilization protein [Tenacibaculum finnmarkense]|uniref:BfmA/BtgA family mobilization protein n=1 Tax=Tenacibaculum finnmarkense TaxID=2781243 RepID=UPI002738F2FA|nr:BfmA/BtgA family mobilization protein [Tenacibaculum finnmarkense]